MVGTLIKGGYVIDPGNGREGKFDVLIKGRTIKKVATCVTPGDQDEVVDATGLLVCPGLIDLHTHCYQYVTPLGVNPDETCLEKGVTTVADAGSSGASTFLGLKKYVIETSRTRVKAFLHVANHGLASAGCTGVDPGGECDSLNQVNVRQAAECINRYPDDIIGIKVRLAEAVCDDGKTEEEVFRRALELRRLTNKPLMVHHAFSSIPILDKSTSTTTTTTTNITTTNINHHNSGLTCPGSLADGDIYTHMYHSLVVEGGKVHPEYTRARKRGVLFDLGHGAGSFNWNVAEICAAEGFWPDTISTDLHTSCQSGPAYHLPSVMSKLLYLGMPMYDVIASVTSRPAHVMKLSDSIGSLSEGFEADVTLLRMVENEVFLLEDSHQNTRSLNRQLKPVATWKGGVRLNCK